MAHNVVSAPAGSGTVPRRAAPARRGIRTRQRPATGLLLVAPAVLLVTVFFLIPLGLTMWISLHKWPLLGKSQWVGLANYLAIPGDSTFLHALGFTVLYTVIITPVLFVIGLGLALLVRRERRGVGIFRTIWFMPWVVGFASAAYLFLWLFNPGLGFVNKILQDLRIVQQPVQWMNTAATGLLAVIVMVVWKVAGFHMLLLMSGLQSIPEGVHEAALVDGSGRWSTLVRVTLPLMRRTVALVLVFSVAGSLLAFEQFYIMTKGGPSNQTLTVVHWIYESSFANFQLGYGSALSVVVLVVLMCISGIQLALLRERQS